MDLLNFLIVWTVVLSSPLCLGQSVSPGGEPAAINFGMRKLAFSTNQFGIDLFRAMSDLGDQRDVVFCPFCISSNLAMLLLGSREHTANSLRQALYLWGMRPPEVHRAFGDLHHHINSNLRTAMKHRSRGVYSRRESDTNDMVYYASMYVQRDFGIKYPYQMYLQRFYNTSAHPLDFVLNAEETRQHINAIVARESDNRIQEILDHRLPPNTHILSMSGMFFKGALAMNMSRVQQHGMSLHQPPQISLESRRARVRYGRHPYLNCTAVEMPLQDGLISLVMVTPNNHDSLSLLEQRLSAQRLSDVLDNLQVTKVVLNIPRLSIRQKHSNLSEPLRRLGLYGLFEPGYANLQDMTDYPWMHVTNMLHQAEIQIHENGPAPTGPPLHPSHQLLFQQQQQIPPDTLRVIMQRPMLFFVIDSLSGMSLIMGKLR